LIENALQNGVKLELNHEVVDIQRADLKKGWASLCC
jgi:L-2-hydroxyglutarate oxidase LhgO